MPFFYKLGSFFLIITAGNFLGDSRFTFLNGIIYLSLSVSGMFVMDAGVRSVMRERRR
jgi:hypothetical protein